MKIKPEISETTISNITVDGQQTAAPTTTTSESETTVMVKDGVTILIGGLKKEKRTKEVAKIPVLGDIPGIGFVFRRTSDSMETNELVILLTPHILTGDKPVTSFSEIPPKTGAVARMDNGKILLDKTNNNPNYNKQILDKINALALFDRPKSAKGSIKLAFTLSYSGMLVDEPRVIETTNKVLNEYAIRAVKEAAPFKHFPESLNKDRETFNVDLFYE